MKGIGSGPRTARAAALRRALGAAALVLALLACAAAAAQAATVTGTVIGPDGEPFAAADVRLLDDGTYAPTDADGRFSHEVPAGEIRVHVRRGSLSFWELEPRTVAAGEDITVRLPARVERTVRVLNGRGEPIADALVRAPRMPSFTEVDGRAVQIDETAFSPAPQARTDTAGEALFHVFPGIEPTDFPLRMGRVEKQGSDYQTALFNWTPGPLTTVVMSRWWPAESPVGGVLRDEDGPLAGVRLQLGYGTATTAPDGTFRFALPGGVHELSAAGNGWSLTGGRYVFAEEPLDLVLPVRRTLTVRVRGELGEPVQGAHVRVPATTVRTNLGGQVPGARLVLAASERQTGADGEARFGLFADSEAIDAEAGTVQGGGAWLPMRFLVPPMSEDRTVTVDDARADVAPNLMLGQRPEGPWSNGSPVVVRAIAADGDLTTLGCSVDGAPVRLATSTAELLRDATFKVRGEGRHLAACAAADSAGHSVSAQREVRIDLRGPRKPVAVFDRPPEYAGNGGWWHFDVDVSFAGQGDRPLADGTPGSGVDEELLPVPQNVRVNGAQTVTGRVRDLAGNLSPVTSVTVQVDGRAPVAVLTCPAQVAQGSSAVGRFTASDDLSGLATPRSGTIPLDTSRLGEQRANYWAYDRVGSAGWAFCDYEVV